MTIGPVQLIVLGFRQPDFRGEIIDELERLRENDTIGLVDALAVYKDPAGEIEIMHLSNASREDAVAAGSMVATLIGIEVEGETNPAGEAEAYGGDDAWDVLEDIPNDSAAALLLIEHRWAIPLRDAIGRAGGFRLADGLISPEDLVQIGLITESEAREIAALER